MTREEIMNYLTEHHINELRSVLEYMATNSCEYDSITWRCEFGSVTLTVGKANQPGDKVKIIVIKED